MPEIRLLAVKTLIEIFTAHIRPKDAIESSSLHLGQRDRAFLMEIVYGVLRFRDTIDWILNQLLTDPGETGDFTLNNLRTAAYQIYFMRVPHWAVVNESVKVEKAAPSVPARGKPKLVNAVLRSLLRQKDRFQIPIKCVNVLSDIAINTSHPEWLIRRWIKRYGEEGARLLAEANNKIPPLTIRINSLRTTRDALLSLLADNGIAAAPTRYSHEGVELKDVRSHNALSFARGLFCVQDEASQLISYLLGPLPGEKVLDACAAPGGKTTHIAQLMRDSGEITAVESDVRRIALLRDNIGELGIRSVIILNDDIGKLRGEGPFDRILVDAPCSATGVIRRNPDIKYRRKERDFLDYRAKQIRLLLATAQLLKVGGRLVYSVCSTEPEEGEQVANEFLKTSGNFRIIDAEAHFLRSFMHEGFLRTYPHLHNMDGFFGVAFCRRK